MTPTQLIEIIRYRIGEGDNDQLDTPILHALNTVLRNIQNQINFYETLALSSVTLVDGTQDYDLASDFLKMRMIWDNATYSNELTRIIPEEYKQYVGDVDTTEGTPRYYDIYDESSNVKQIHFSPVPSAAATAPYMYHKKKADLTSGGSANILTTFYPDLFIEGAAYLMYRDEIYRDQPEKIAHRETQYLKQIELVKKAQRTPHRIDAVNPKRLLPTKAGKLYTVQHENY